MKHSIEITSIDDQSRLLPQTEKDEIEEGSKVDHSININQILVKMFEDLDNSSIKSRTMFKVNVWLRESNPNAYTPKMVSIGPYHKKDVQLHPMEKYKWLYLRQFLGRKEELDLESCIKELEGLKEEALKCYDDVDTDEFCQMLLLDGCFVVEFLRDCWGMFLEREEKIINLDYVHIFRDLILLENQLPFFVLNRLYNITKRDNEPLLAQCILWLPFFVDFPAVASETFKEIAGGNIKHLLHLKHAISCHGNGMKKQKEDLQRPTEACHGFRTEAKGRNLCGTCQAGGCYNIKSILGSVCRHLGHAGNERKNDSQTWHMVMPNATELSEAGVRFAKATIETSIFDRIKFENGLMTIPRFRVENSTETFLRNLIAYEQQSSDVQHKYFSNFAIFMDKLIESEKDVNLLCREGIIENWLGDNKEVANLFNKIGNWVVVKGSDFCYEEECRKVVEHCRKPWNKMMASLSRNYFSSPWVGASTVAAFLLLKLTLIQTIAAVIGLVNK